MRHVARGSRSSNVAARRRTVPAVLCLAALAAACGGGSTPTAGDPTPAAVTEVTESDLEAAGVPDPTTLAGLAAGRLGTARLAGDFDNDGDVDAADYLVWRNVAPLEEGGGFATDVPAADEDLRIVAWVIYELPTAANSHLAWLQAHFTFSGPDAPFFFAVANAVSETWEIGGPILDPALEKRHWRPDGTRHAPPPPNFRRSFSQSQDYVWPGGGTYLLVAVGNPGTSPVGGITCRAQGWTWSAILDSAEEAFALGTEGSCSWDFVGGFDTWDRSGVFSYIQDGSTYEQDFSSLHTTGSPRLLFAQPMNIRVDGGGGDDRVTHHAVVNVEDYDLWRAAFFNPGELNGWLHPFTLHVRVGPADSLNVAPLLDLDGTTGTTRGIIAILVGLKGPVEGAQVDLVSAEDEIAFTTGPAGALPVPILDDRSYQQLVVTYVDDEGQPVRLTYELEVDQAAGHYRVR